MVSVGTSIKNVIFEIFIIFLTILSWPFFLFVLPILFILPLYLYRSCVKCLAKYLNPGADRIMSARNCVVAVDTVHTKPEQSIIVTIALSDNLDYSLFYDRVEDSILRKKTEEGGPLYPEFQEYYESWGGYLFWKKDPNFQMTNHIRTLTLERESVHVTYEQLRTYCLDLVQKPFVWGRSPWEIIIVNNFYHPDMRKHVSVIIFHVHHGLCDGYSILEFLVDVVQQWGEAKEKLPAPVYSAGAVSPRFITYVWMSLCAPYFLIRESIGSYDRNKFRIGQKKLTKRLRIAQMQMSVDAVKSIRVKCGVTFSSVIFAAVTGGFRNYMISRGWNVPDLFHVGMPFPWPRTGVAKLQNNMCVSIFKFPVGTSQVKKRLQIIDRMWSQMKNSPVSLINWTFMPILGLFPGPLLKLFVQNNLTTMVFSNFPGPAERVQVIGTTTEDIEFVTGLWRGNCGIGVGLISTNGRMKLNLGVDESLTESQEEVDKIMEFIESEFKLLGDLDLTKTKEKLKTGEINMSFV